MGKENRIPVENNSTNPYFQKQYITKRDKSIYDFFRNYTYLNGYSPSKKEVAAYFGTTEILVSISYSSLVQAGLLLHEPTSRAEPRLPDYASGMCRVQFKGEVTKNGIKPTKESLVNFYDLINSVYFVAYRLMVDLTIPYYKVGDYLIVSTASEYKDDVVLLCLDDDRPMICRYNRRTHDCLLTNYVDGSELRTHELTIVGEIVGSIRCELPIEKMYLRNRIQVIENE